MNENNHVPCSWWLRVSALADGELPENEKPLVDAHLRNCQTCARLAGIEQHMALGPAIASDRTTALLNLLPNKPSFFIRTILFAIGVFVLANSMPTFIRGNTDGDALHDLRHLAIWQVAIGVAVIFSAFTFKLSRILSVILVTFLLLTFMATLYDLLTGHRGPWTDEMHIVEVVAVILLLRLIWPQLRLLSRINSKKQQNHNTKIGFAKTTD